jgi:ribosomal protein S27AE
MNNTSSETIGMLKNPLICPQCGGAMNHHADKVVYSTAAPKTQTTQDIFGGVVEETHTCPACGAIETRPAE